MKYRAIAIALICFISLTGLLSCGLEEVFYIDYIPSGDYKDTSTVIILPEPTRENGYDRDYGYFDNFIIFYRLYISPNLVQTGNLKDDSTARVTVNSALNSDYGGLNSLTDITSTSVNTSNLESTFSTRRYFLLTLENADINRVLNSDSLTGERRLEISFDTNNGVQPVLRVNNGPSYNLRRAVENVNLNLYDLNPLPDRRFLNHPELYNTANVTSGRNADVAANGAADLRYTYVSMYIAARGTGDIPPRTIYSQPTFAGIFRLSEWSN